MDDRMKQRCDELFAIGLRFNGQSYVGNGSNSDVNFHHTDILCDDDQKWNNNVQKVKVELERREAIRVSEVPKCSVCGLENLSDCPSFPCTLEEDRKSVNVFK